MADKKKVTLSNFLGGEKIEQNKEQSTQDDVNRSEQENNSTENAVMTFEETISDVDNDRKQTDEKEKKNENQEIEKSEIKERKEEPGAQVTIEEVSQSSQAVEPSIKSYKIQYFFITLVLFLFGFLIGQYYETSTRNTVYVLDEAKFLKLASIGIATSDQDKTTTNLSQDDKDKVRTAIVEVNRILGEQYTKYPVLIQKRNKKGYDVYSMARRIDITVPLIIQLIGEDKWKEIGNVLK